MIEETEVEPFEVCGDLPSGVTVLEASAGTGKTYTIAALAARYVAAGTPLEQILLITFTRIATGELRERVRERLVSAEQALGHTLAGALPPDADEVVRLLADGSGDQVRRRRERLAEALADFDSATIATTHSFCQEVLGGLGVAGELERDADFVEDAADLVEEALDDLYVRAFHGGQDPPFSRRQALQIAHAAVGNPGARIEPAAAAPGSAAARRSRLATAVRAEVDERKRRNAIMTYDDLLTRLAAALHGPSGEQVAAAMRARWGVVLVDEFQDTDPIQWDIVHRAFGDGGTTLVLIGDPKQAIYAFRGADVYAYLDAAAAAGVQKTLTVNRRSDQGLIDAYDALFGGARLGHDRIVYREVRAAPENVAPRLAGAPVAAPLRVRVVHRDDPGVSLTQRTGHVTAPSGREHVARDVAADLVRLLGSGALVDGEPIAPGHVAVLVRKHRTGGLVRDALEEVGIPAVINGAGSVFATPQALDWLRLLEALERPAATGRAHLAALTPFLGWTPERVACAAEEEWEEVHRRLHEWARILRDAGVAALSERVTLSEGLPERVLGTVDGERRLTDLRHVGQLLHAAATDEQLGTTALTSWLRRRIAEGAQDTSDEERSRRLESDAEAVQVLTIHRSKGLEFPVVYCPDLWDPPWIRDEKVPVDFHDADNRRVIDVGLEGPDYDAHREQHLIEQRGEDLRLAYVALTRARHQAVVWWAPSRDSAHSALARLLFSRAPDGTVDWQGRVVPADEAVVGRLRELAAEAPGCIAVERAAPGPRATWAGPAKDPAPLAAAAFDREIDRRWRRTSYSDISAGTHEARVASEPEEGVVTDEPDEAAPAAPAPDPGHPARAVPSPLAAMPVGMRVGTFVHDVLERCDFRAPDLGSELDGQVSAALARRALDVGDPAAVAAGLRAAIETPLDPLLGGARLRDLGRADRLDELEFELPLAGGDDPAGRRVTLAAVADLLREHVPGGDPLAGYAERLDDPGLRQSVRGYLTGSIDLVLRLDGRFAVVDYKTNWLGGPDDELTAWHYRPAALAAEMQRAHYGLQALLYTVALHRYLRWRLPGYDADRHLAGVLYLFVRGMTGADAPVVDGGRCGVFAWRPSGALVEALSDALAGDTA